MDKKHTVKNIRRNQAISEIIGTMLMLGISVSLFSVVYISVLTVPYSPPTPSVNIICQIDDGNIVLSHYGGKALNFDSQIVLIVDGQPVDPIPAGDYLYNDSNGDGLWSVGEKVVFSYASLVSGGEQIEVNILDTGSNSLVMTGTFQEEIDSVLSISTSVDTINPYELTSSPFDITATGPLNLDNVTLYYRWSDDNSTWDGTFVVDENNNTVDNNGCDEDASLDIGTETNFANAQDVSPDSDYMNIQENNTGIGGGSGEITMISNTTASHTGAKAITITKPASIANDDVLVVYLFHDNQGTVGHWNLLSGWTHIFNISDDPSGRGGTTSAQYKIITDSGSEPSDYTFTHSDSANENIGAIMVALRGVDTSDVLANDVGYSYLFQANMPDFVSPTITTDEDDALVLCFGSMSHTTISYGNKPTGTTKIAYVDENYANVMSAYFTQESAGATGNKQWDTDAGGSHEARGCQIAFKPIAVANINYTMNFEYQWTTAGYDKENKEVCIYVDSHTGSENLNINYYNGGSWINLGTINSAGWNNFTATGLISSTYTIQLIGATESSDSIQDTWDIDCIYLRTWNSTGGSYGWTKFGTDMSHPWIWSFDFPIGIGYYQFYSIGQKSGLSKEIAPAFSDAICKKI